MGQHYHVFFHKRRYSYGSPVCGLLSLIVYGALLYYMIVKFAAIIMIEDYVNVEQFKPIDFTDNNITMGHFFESVDMQFVFDMVSNDTKTWYCPNFLDIATLESQNPDKNITLTITYDLK